MYGRYISVEISKAPYFAVFDIGIDGVALRVCWSMVRDIDEGIFVLVIIRGKCELPWFLL